MHIKTIASATLFAAMLGFGGAAYAQTTIDGVTVTEVDMPLVEEYCAQLQSGMMADTETTASPAVEEEGAVDENQAPDAKDDSVPTLDLSAITLEGCKEAGFVTE